MRRLAPLVLGLGLLAALVFAFPTKRARPPSADLTGKFLFEGKPPAPRPIDDPKLDFELPELKVVDESLIVDPQSRGIANIVVYVRTPNVPITAAADRAVAPPLVVDAKDGQFRPRVGGVWVGRQELVFRNTGPVHVNMNFLAAEVNPLLGPMNRELKIPLKQSFPVPHPFVCNIYVWMKGFILARDNPYFAVTGSDGTFALKNLPTGVPLEIQVWHERPGYLNADSTWTKGRFTVTLDADHDLGTIEVPPELLR